ncbi:hypothetical protein AGR9A_Lc80087 [Agrobacterium salinitolerans str. Hayward 0363]|nr:hypothetical protein AGR9A_Lc80087 [Agrobacterium salinitolerans str. Hayward 0363]
MTTRERLGVRRSRFRVSTSSCHPSDQLKEACLRPMRRASSAFHGGQTSGIFNHLKRGQINAIN